MIHDHPIFKLGLTEPKRAPAIKLSSILSPRKVDHPLTVDHFAGCTFGMYGNDKYGTCGPTSAANHMRLTSKGLTGTMVAPSLLDVYDLYRRSGNPNFPREDNGVDMQTMLEAMVKGGLAGIYPVAFAEVDTLEDDELETAVDIFGGTLWGANLLEAQQYQTEAIPPRWEYKKSPEWGGHAIVNGAFEPTKLEDVISWEKRVQATESFRAKQLEQAWVVIWPWHLGHQAFHEGIDLAKLAIIYKELTGASLPLPEPSPPPTPPPFKPPIITPEDQALWIELKPWALARHVRSNKTAAKSVIRWAKAKGLA